MNNKESTVKDNNTFIDTEGDTVLIALWNDSIHQVQHDSGYTIFQVKYRRHNGKGSKKGQLKVKTRMGEKRKGRT